MKIIITGANGEVGQSCAKVMQNKHHVHTFSSSELDIRNKQTVKDALSSIKPDAVINAAAYTAVDLAEDNYQQALEVNADAVLHLAQTCQKFSIRLVHYSTDYVFDGTKKVPLMYTEDDLTSPINTYGKTKLAGENHILTHMDTYTIIRTSWVYGPHGKNFLRSIFDIFSQHPGKSLNIVNDQFGCPTYSFDLAYQTQLLIEQEATGLYHVSSNGYTNWFEFAATFFSLLNIDTNLSACPSSTYPTKAQRPSNSILKNKKLQDQSFDNMPIWKDSLSSFISTHKDSLFI